MLRDAQTIKLKPTDVKGKNFERDVIVLPESLKDANDKNNYFAVLPPGDRGAVTEPTLYPVEFDKAVPNGFMHMGLELRNYFFYDMQREIPLELIPENKLGKEPAAEVSLEVRRALRVPPNQMRKLDRERFAEGCRINFGGRPLYKGQPLYFNYEGVIYELKVNNIGPAAENQVYYISHTSKINISMTTDPKLAPALAHVIMRDKPINKTLPLDFYFKGVGGHKKELENLVREAFFSRANPSTAKKLGIKHAKGVLLYGPPGTGKTLIARTIADMFPQNHVKVVNGPEVLNKLVGQSEENIRNLFSDAEKEMQKDPDDSELHVIIFDEFDAIASARGVYSDNTGVKAGLVTQLSSFLDGFLARPNVLIICTTNRIDLIDAALLRPGRIDTLIEIGLPTEEERLEILKIMTSAMTDNHLLDKDVDLSYWANKTKDYSGAELQALVSKAGKHYLRYFFEASEDRKELRIKKDVDEIERTKKVTREFFEEAFKEITPAYGIDKSRFNFDIKKFADNYDENIVNSLDSFKSAVTDMQASANMKKLNVLISGGKGTGKTELAKNMAYQSGVTNIRVITANDLLALPLNGKLKFIIDEFKHAQQTKFSAVILDGLEDILKSDIYQDVMRINIEKLLSESTESPNKCIIIATTNNPEEIERKGLSTLFSEKYEVQNVRISNANDARNTLEPICKAMGYNFVPSRSQTTDYILDMPIRELRYKIDRFCLHNRGELRLDQFFVQLNEKNVKQRDLLPELPVTSILSRNSSPIHQQQPVDKSENRKSEVHFVSTP